MHIILIVLFNARTISLGKMFLSCKNNDDKKIFRQKNLISCEFLTLSSDAEFWKQVPPNEPYRVILGDVRDKLYQTRERARQLLAHGYSDIPEEATYTNIEQVCTSIFLSVAVTVFYM